MQIRWWCSSCWISADVSYPASHPFPVSCTMALVQKDRKCQSLITIQSKPSLFPCGSLPQEVASAVFGSCACVTGYYGVLLDFSHSYTLLGHCAHTEWRSPAERELLYTVPPQVKITSGGWYERMEVKFSVRLRLLQGFSEDYPCIKDWRAT